MQRRLAAIMSADVVGYSRLMGEDEAGTLDLAFDDLGEKRAKNIAKPLRVYSARLDGAKPAGADPTGRAAGAARQAVDRGAAVHQPVWRSRAGVLCRRHDRGRHHRLGEEPLVLRNRPQFELHLQGPDPRHQAGRPRIGRALRARRQRAQGRQPRPRRRPSWSTRRPARMSGPSITTARSRTSSRCKTT